MFMFLFGWNWRNQPIYTVFSRRYEKRKRGRRFLLMPEADVQRMEDLTPYEVGQLLGGN